jgi:hypothetical protein
MFDTSRDEMNNWRWDNSCAFGDQVDCTNPQIPSSEKVKSTSEHFSWYGSDDLRERMNCETASSTSQATC